MGPCLCGDPYCSSCGNPAEAAFADWVEHFADFISDLKPTEDEATFIEAVIPQLLDSYRKASKEVINRHVSEALQGAEWELMEKLAKGYRFQCHNPLE